MLFGISVAKIAAVVLSAVALAGGHHHHHKHHPYRFYDSAQVTNIRSHEASAVYATGGYVAHPRQIRRLGHTLWIDVFGHDYEASVLDVEPGDANPRQAGVWAAKRLFRHKHSVARIYMSRSEWPAVRYFVHTEVPRGRRNRVHYWVADPTGVRHIVPGAYATQWKWSPSVDYDVARPGF